VPTVQYGTGVDETSELVARFVAGAFGELGITMEYCTMDFGSLQASRSAGRFPVFSYAWAGDYPDPEVYLRPLFHSAAAVNFSAYANPTADRLLDEARSEPDPQRRVALYREAESVIISDAPCVVLYETTPAILLNPRWQGIPLGHIPELLEVEFARPAPGS
jgi:ABC-type transport system substrate-binding protein